MSDWPYKDFTKKEMACKCPRDCEMKDGSKMDPDFMRDLQVTRDVYDDVMTIVSGLRCAWWNEKSGGEKDSAHLTGNGADISCTRSRQRFTIMGVFRGLFTRIGLAKTFIHVDNLPIEKKAQEVMWVY
jgi:hypothetical protein